MGKVLSPWMALQTIKTQLRNTEDTLNDEILSFADNGIPLTNGFNAIGASGAAYLFSKSGDWLKVKYTLPQSDGTFVTGETGYGSFNDISEYLLANASLSLESMIQDIRDGMTTNELYADVCDMFQKSQSLSLSDLDSAINATLCTDADKSTTIGMIKSCIVDGKLNNFGWLQILQNIFNTGKTSADAGTTMMDTSSPFAIQSILSTVLSIASVVINVVAAALSIIINPLIMVIGSLVSQLMSWASKYISNNVSTDIDANSYFVQGPVKYSYNYTAYQDSSAFAGFYNNNPITYFNFGPLSVFQWVDPNAAQSILGKSVCVNAFMTFGLDVDKVFEYLSTHPTMECDKQTHSGVDYLAWRPLSSVLQADGAGYKSMRYFMADTFYVNDEYYLSIDKILEILSDASKATKYLHALNVIWLASNFKMKLINNEVPWFITNTLWSSTDFGENIPHWTPFGRYSNAKEYCWPQLFLETSVHNTLYTYNTIPGAGSLHVQVLQDIYNGLITPYAESDLLELSIIQEDTADITSVGKVGRNYHYMFSLGAWGTGNDIWMAAVFSGYESCDTIPTQRCCKIPDITTDQLVAALAIIASVVAAAVIAKTVTSRILAKRRLSKQLMTANELSGLKSQYETTKDPQDYMNYYKAMRRYNFKAKLLGWQTYDPVNNWFNSADGSVAAIVASNATLPDTFKAATETFTVVNSSLYGNEAIASDLSSAKTSIDDVYKAIV